MQYSHSKSSDCPNLWIRMTRDSRTHVLLVRMHLDNYARVVSELRCSYWHDSPLALVRAVFFVWKGPCPRQGQEQHDLKPSQFQRQYERNCYVYVENGSVNHPGAFGHGQQSNKVVTLYANPCLVYQCAVYYFSKLPQSPSTLPFFYLRPLSRKPKRRKSTLVLIW